MSQKDDLIEIAVKLLRRTVEGDINWSRVEGRPLPPAYHTTYEYVADVKGRTFRLMGPAAYVARHGFTTPFARTRDAYRLAVEMPDGESILFPDVDAVRRLASIVAQRERTSLEELKNLLDE
jgi:hypothetical protein